MNWLGKKKKKKKPARVHSCPAADDLHTFVSILLIRALAPSEQTVCHLRSASEASLTRRSCSRTFKPQIFGRPRYPRPIVIFFEMTKLTFVHRDGRIVREASEARLKWNGGVENPAFSGGLLLLTHPSVIQNCAFAIARSSISDIKDINPPLQKAFGNGINPASVHAQVIVLRSDRYPRRQGPTTRP